MPVKTVLSVPSSVTSQCRFRSAISRLDGRIPGKGLTGTDIQLWLVLLDHLRRSDNKKVVRIPNAELGHAMGRIDAKRVTASLDRLRGYDVWIGNTVIPAVVAFERLDGVWIVQMDIRWSMLTDEARPTSSFVEVPMSAIRTIQSRYSTVLYLRWLSWHAGVWPHRSVAIGANPDKTAFQLEVDIVDLPWLFGYDELLHESQIKNLFLSKKSTSPLRRDLAGADVHVDTSLTTESAYGKLRSLKLLISTIRNEGIDILVNRHRHEVIDRKNRSLKFQQNSTGPGRLS